jgi:hypothetical protein
MRRFYLNRSEDVSGTSGVSDKIAEGVEFDTGAVALTWLTPYSSVAFYSNMRCMQHIHGHGGKTKIDYIDPVEEC